MYKMKFMNELRMFEAALYNGPETVEHVYESDDHFQAHKSRRRHAATSLNGEKIETEITMKGYYYMEFDKETGDAIYSMFDE